MGRKPRKTYYPIRAHKVVLKQIFPEFRISNEAAKWLDDFIVKLLRNGRDAAVTLTKFSSHPKTLRPDALKYALERE